MRRAERMEGVVLPCASIAINPSTPPCRRFSYIYSALCFQACRPASDIFYFAVATLFAVMPQQHPRGILNTKSVSGLDSLISS